MCCNWELRGPDWLREGKHNLAGRQSRAGVSPNQSTDTEICRPTFPMHYSRGFRSEAGPDRAIT
jgi:hypothetical protein